MGEGANFGKAGPTGTMQIVCRRWLPIWSATTSPLSQRRFRPRRRLRCRRKSRGPFNFWKTTPHKESLVRFMCPKTRRNWLRLPIVRFHLGPVAPSSRPEAKPHPRRRPPQLPVDFADDETGVGLLDGPRCREAAFSHAPLTSQCRRLAGVQRDNRTRCITKPWSASADGVSDVARCQMPVMFLDHPGYRRGQGVLAIG